MKILLLNPRVDMEHQLIRDCEERGIPVLLTGDARDAFQLLHFHGPSIDLVVIHLEGDDSGEAGLELIKKMKRDPQWADVPTLMTTESWSDEQCSDHQNSAQGANAYLHWPVDPQKFFSTIEQVFGESLPPGALREQDLPPPVPEHHDLEAPPALTVAFDTSGVDGSTDELPPPVPAKDLPTEPPTREPDSEVEGELPYLFGDTQKPPVAVPTWIDQPLGDAVVPGGAASSPDVDTLKKFLLLREQDVAALSAQLMTAKERVSQLEAALRAEQQRNDSLQHELGEKNQKLEEFEGEKAQTADVYQGQIRDLKFQLKTKTDKAKVMELQVKEVQEELIRLKDRVRVDLRKIRLREKELENRLEIVKKDSEVLIGAREARIIELKRKLDLVEFNMDLLQEQYSREKEESQQLRQRLTKASQAMRVAGGLLDEPAPLDTSSEEDEPAGKQEAS